MVEDYMNYDLEDPLRGDGKWSLLVRVLEGTWFWSQQLNSVCPAVN